jgi:hypothetical protein
MIIHEISSNASDVRFTPGRGVFRYHVTAPKNRSVTFWVEVIRDGNLDLSLSDVMITSATPIPVENGKSPVHHGPFRFDRDFEFSMTDFPSAGRPRVQWQWVDEAKRFEGFRVQSRWFNFHWGTVVTTSKTTTVKNSDEPKSIIDPFAVDRCGRELGLVRQDTSWGRAGRWKVGLGENCTLLEVRGYRQSGDTGGSEEAPVIELFLKMRFDPLHKGDVQDDYWAGYHSGWPLTGNDPLGRPFSELSGISKETLAAAQAVPACQNNR